MKADFSNAIEAFINDFVRDLADNNVAIFAGAGMSKGAGFVDWPELLRDIATELGLQIEKEHDLISLAQYHVNSRRNADGIAKKILREFSEQAELTETHKIVARLPIGTYWTTNYDTLIEDAIRAAYRIPDVKHNVDQLSTAWPKRDAIVYKMHGDVTFPKDAVLYKQQYERYYRTHARFITALEGDLVSKTFLFIGFSFTDPNLDYVLSRLHVDRDRPKQHYCFMRREHPVAGEDAEVTAYKRVKQELRTEDLKRFGILTLLVDDYEEVPSILREVESRFRKRTVFISGSAEEFGSWSRVEALSFVHLLSSALIQENFRVVSGFGWGIGSAVINGALETIHKHPQKYSQDQLIVRPFPQVASSKATLENLWAAYRERMVKLAGIAIFLFGNKPDEDGNVVIADGVLREFEIAVAEGLVPIPIGVTEFAARRIWEVIEKDPTKYYRGVEGIVSQVAELSDPKADRASLLKKLTAILKQLSK